MIKKKMFICEECRMAFSDESSALHCEETHNKGHLATRLLSEGATLEQINIECGFQWNLRDDLKVATQDSCFVMSYWQCCDKPAYRIRSIDGHGTPYLWGCGSWSGYYGGDVRMHNLPLAHGKEELFVDKRYTNRFV